FFAREEVLALRNALQAIEWPDDELAVYATLHGPLFALTDDALLTFKNVSGKLHPLRPLDPVALPVAAQEVAQGLAALKTLHFARNRRPIADTLAQLLEATRAHAGLAFWRAGDQALANLTQMMELARRFEIAGGRSFRAFVQELETQAEEGESPEAPIVEEGSEGVRMMTVHAAKGLEFPVVILAEPTARHERKDPSHYVNAATKLWAEPLAWCKPVELMEHAEDVRRRDKEESVRLTYVAATRARDLLVVPVVGDERQPGWVDVLHPVLYPKHEDMLAARPAPGCPEFAGETTLERPESVWGATSVAPGLHRPEVGEHSVVWWDPKTLELDKGHTTGLHQDELLRDDEGGKLSAEGMAAYQAWSERREEQLERGRKRSMRVVTAREVSSAGATGQAQTEGSTAVAVEVETTAVNRDGRPSGRRFGSLVHNVLATVPLKAELAELSRTVEQEARAMGCSKDEREAAVQAVEAALKHPLLTRAATSNAVRRELPVSVKLEDGTLAEGVIDLAFDTPEGWQVIDFKTDEHRAEHERQVALYVKAISAATGRPAKGVLLSV
ncbi:MAG: 3'-5' exonuclease, partial [Myxococcaceae bacterium]